MSAAHTTADVLRELKTEIADLRADRDRLAERADANADQWVEERERADRLAARLAGAEKWLQEVWTAYINNFDMTTEDLDAVRAFLGENRDD